MYKKYLFFIVLLSTLILSSCGKKTVDNPGPWAIEVNKKKWWTIDADGTKWWAILNNQKIIKSNLGERK